jgi:HK97 family phage prohead protease
MTVERLSFGLGEVKLAGTDGEMTFSGYGAVFGNVDSYGDVIAKGAFKDTLAHARKSGTWPAMLSQHGGGFLQADMTPIGVWTEMREDETGLFVEGKLANTERGREAYELLKMTPRPAYSGMSIGFMAKKWSVRTKPGDPRRTLEAVELMEVSLVTFPANPKARVTGVKSDFNPREIEDGLREAGLSRTDSVKAVAVLREMLQRDAGEPETTPGDQVDAVEQRKTETDLASLALRIRALR